MSDLVSCPTCQSTLRLPPTAATVRCPKCKTLLEVVDDSAPPDAEPDAPPLPFAGAPAARPKAAPAKPVQATRRRLRPDLVDEVAEAEEKAAKQAVQRKREVRKQLREMDEQEAIEEEEFEDTEEQCGWGRLAMGWVRYGMAGYAIGVLLVFFALLGFVIFTAMGTPFGAVMAPVAFGGLAVGVIGTLILVVGFGLALKGPPMGRHVAAFGLVATALQVIAVAATIGTAIGKVTGADAEFKGDTGWGGTTLPYYVLGLVTNLFLLADLPTRLALHYENPTMWAVLAAVFEFARLVFVCQLIQSYAEAGKNDRAAADAGKGISRVFWVILLTSMFRFAIAVGFDWFPNQDTMWVIGQVLHGLLFIVAFGFFGFRLLLLVQGAADATETLLADRVASKAAKLDVV